MCTSLQRAPFTSHAPPTQTGVHLPPACIVSHFSTMQKYVWPFLKHLALYPFCANARFVSNFHFALRHSARQSAHKGRRPCAPHAYIYPLPLHCLQVLQRHQGCLASYRPEMLRALITHGQAGTACRRVDSLDHVPCSKWRSRKCFALIMRATQTRFNKISPPYKYPDTQVALQSY